MPLPGIYWRKGKREGKEGRRRRKKEKKKEEEKTQLKKTHPILHRLCACLGLGFAPSRRGRVCRVVSCRVRSAPLNHSCTYLHLRISPPETSLLAPPLPLFFFFLSPFTLTQPDRERPTYLRPLRVRPERSLLAEASFLCVLCSLSSTVFSWRKKSSIQSIIHFFLPVFCALGRDPPISWSSPSCCSLEPC